MTPTPDRYKLIQEALVAKGYPAGTPDGTWGRQWAEALKQFQRDKNLPEPSGKVTSLSLITLGLGPKREAAGSPTPGASGPDGFGPVKRELK